MHRCRCLFVGDVVLAAVLAAVHTNQYNHDHYSALVMVVLDQDSYHYSSRIVYAGLEGGRFMAEESRKAFGLSRALTMEVSDFEMRS